MRGTWALVVVALAAVLRLGWLELAQFQSDEATWLRIGEDLVRLGRVPLYGPLSSQGITQAPEFEYFLALAAAVSRDPLWVTATVALVNVAGVAGTVWLGWRAFGPLAGLVAGVLFAVCPGAVFYARKIWPPDVLPALSVLLLVALEQGVVRRRAGWAAASLPIATLAALTHFGFVVLTPLVLAPLVVLVRLRHWALLGIGVGLAVLLCVPYGLHQVQTGWADAKNLRYYASSVPVAVDAQALGYALSLATGQGGLRVADVLPPTDALPSAVWDAAALVATVLLGLSVALALWQVLLGEPTRGWRGVSVAPRDGPGVSTGTSGGPGVSTGTSGGPGVSTGTGGGPGGSAGPRGSEGSLTGSRAWPARRVRLLGLLLWLLVPVLATTRHSLPLQPHYYLALLPVPFLLVGVLCQWLLDVRARVPLARVPIVRMLVGVALGGVAVVVAVQVVAVGRLLEYVATQYEPCYGAPLRWTEDVARQAISFGALGGATRASIENEDGDADSIAYLVRGAFGQVDQAAVGPIGIGARGPAVQATLSGLQPVALSFEPGVRAMGAMAWDDPLQGGRVRVAFNWQVNPSAEWARPLVWEVRLSNGQNQVVQRASGIDHIPAAMQGEHVLSWFTLDTPREIGPGPYQVHLRLLDADRGAAVGDEWVSAPFAISQTARCRTA